MARWDFWKAIGQKKNANREFDKLKADIQAELDRAILKVDTGAIVYVTVGALSDKLSDLIGANFIAGIFVRKILTSVDWQGLAKKPSDAVLEFLLDLREDVGTWRL